MVIFSDTSSQPDSRGTFTSGVNASVEYLLDAFQELGLGDSWISEEKDVDIASDVVRTSFEGLGDTSEHGECQRALDSGMAVNGGGNGSINFLIKFFLSWKFDEPFLGVIILLEVNSADALNTIGLDFSGKERESLLDIERHVIPVFVNTGDLDLLSWLGDIHVVSKQDDFLAAGDSAGEDFGGWLLDSDLLVVPVDSFLFDLLEGSSRLTRNTLPMLDVLGVIGVHRLLDMPTSLTLVEDNLQLVEHFRPDGNNATN
jgi:hypothetical protein